MTAAEMEKQLLTMQDEFKRERDPAKQAAIRTRYKKLHGDWINARREQLTLKGV